MNKRLGAFLGVISTGLISFAGGSLAQNRPPVLSTPIFTTFTPIDSQAVSWTKENGTKSNPKTLLVAQTTEEAIGNAVAAVLNLFLNPNKPLQVQNPYQQPEFTPNPQPDNYSLVGNWEGADGGNLTIYQNGNVSQSDSSGITRGRYSVNGEILSITWREGPGAGTQNINYQLSDGGMRLKIWGSGITDPNGIDLFRK